MRLFLRSQCAPEHGEINPYVGSLQKVSYFASSPWTIHSMEYMLRFHLSQDLRATCKTIPQGVRIRPAP